MRSSAAVALRFRLRRLRRSRLMLSALCLAAMAITVNALGAAERRAASWGRLRDVVVVTAEVEPGAVIGAGDVERRRLPSAMVAASALSIPADVVGRRSNAALWPGEIVVAGRLARAGQSGVAARLRRGERGVTFATGDTVNAAVGDAVDVVAADASGLRRTFGRGRVVAVDRQSVTVGLAAAVAADAAEASLGGRAVVVLRGD